MRREGNKKASELACRRGERGGPARKGGCEKSEEVGLTMAGRLGESRRVDKGVEEGLCCVEEEDP